MPGLFTGELPPIFEWGTDWDKAIEHICTELKKGLWPQSTICDRMVPRIPKSTLLKQRGRNEEHARMIDDAFDIGKDQLAASMILCAQGVHGFTTGELKRDRLLIDTQEKLLAKWDRRYRERLVHENDAENPMPVPTFVLQPVKSLQEIEKTKPSPAEATPDDE